MGVGRKLWNNAIYLKFRCYSCGHIAYEKNIQLKHKPKFK